MLGEISVNSAREEESAMKLVNSRMHGKRLPDHQQAGIVQNKMIGGNKILELKDLENKKVKSQLIKSISKKYLDLYDIAE